MANRRDKRDRRGKRQGQRANRPHGSSIRVRRVPGQDCWRLVHPRCVLERKEDIDEVRQMLTAGEVEIATDELRWLLDGCGDFIEAHEMLGELAQAAGNLNLARGHFGYAYQIGITALDAEGIPGPLPYELPENRSFLDAALRLATCLMALGKRKAARRVLKRLQEIDPQDPLGARGVLREFEERTD